MYTSLAAWMGKDHSGTVQGSCTVLDLSNTHVHACSYTIIIELLFVGFIVGVGVLVMAVTVGALIGLVKIFNVHFKRRRGRRIQVIKCR